MKKRATARRSYDAFDDAESARRALCTMIFENPAVIADCLSHEVTHTLDVRTHSHVDLIQFDIIAGCRGQVVVADQVTAIHGTTLLVAYPGQPHGYTLMPGEPPSEVWLVKLRLPRIWRGGKTKPLPSVITGLKPQPTLMESLVGFTTYWSKNNISAVGLAHLAMAFASWPAYPADLPDQRYEPIPAEGESPLSRVRRLAHTLMASADEQPSLDVLADAAGLSPRHFARLFREEFSCTPHAYITANRMDAARRLLMTPGVRVAQAADQLGFTSPAAFSRWFTRLAGQSPRRYREDPETF